MRPSTVRLALAATALTLVAPLDAQPLPAARRLVLLHANVIDGTGAAPLRDVSIVLDGGKISSIGTANASGAVVGFTIYEATTKLDNPTVVSPKPETVTAAGAA